MMGGMLPGYPSLCQSNRAYFPTPELQLVLGEMHIPCSSRRTSIESNCCFWTAASSPCWRVSLLAFQMVVFSVPLTVG